MLGVDEDRVVVLGVGVLADLRHADVVLLPMHLRVQHRIHVVLLLVVLLPVEGLREVVAPVCLP